MRRRAKILLAGVGTLIAGALALSCLVASMVSMPGHSYAGSDLANGSKSHAPDRKQTIIRDNLRKDLKYLAQDIGERSIHKSGSLEKSADYIAAQLALASPQAKVERQYYTADGRQFQNVVIELRGDTRPDEVIVVGAHYDTVPGCAGADDNGSGVVGMLELARQFARLPHARTLRFVAFANEEMYFRTANMGSYQYAKRCRDSGEKVIAMLALETIGYYDEAAHSQHYPPLMDLLYPDRGNFIAFVGDTKNAGLVRQLVRSFRLSAKLPSEAIAAVREIPGIDWSDHLPFWQFDYPALMITDTAPYRNPNYHRDTDTIETINFEKMALLISGLMPGIQQLSKI